MDIVTCSTNTALETACGAKKDPPQVQERVRLTLLRALILPSSALASSSFFFSAAFAPAWFDKAYYPSLMPIVPRTRSRSRTVSHSLKLGRMSACILLARMSGIYARESPRPQHLHETWANLRPFCPVRECGRGNLLLAGRRHLIGGALRRAPVHRRSRGDAVQPSLPSSAPRFVQEARQNSRGRSPIFA